MSRWSIFKCLAPGRLWTGIRRRGVAGAAVHSLRKAGAVLDRALVGPYLIRLNPMGYVCNHHCPMCWLQHQDPVELKRQLALDREQGMRLEEYVRLFDHMTPGLQEVNIVGGGEPLVHPEAVGLMREVKRRGWHGSLITNGTLMREDVARAMIQAGWDSTRVSVHAGDPETYRAIQGVDRFETMRENLKTFDRVRRELGRAAQCELAVFHVIQRENIPTIEKLFELAEEVGADRLVFEKIIPYDSEKWLTAEELKRAEERLTACAAASRVPCNLEDALPRLEAEAACASEGKPFRPAARCSVGFDQAFITSLGDVMPCCFANESMGNLRERTFSEIWWGKKYKAFRTRLINGRFADYCINNRCAMKGVLHD